MLLVSFLVFSLIHFPFHLGTQFLLYSCGASYPVSYKARLVDGIFSGSSSSSSDSDALSVDAKQAIFAVLVGQLSFAFESALPSASQNLEEAEKCFSLVMDPGLQVLPIVFCCCACVKYFAFICAAVWVTQLFSSNFVRSTCR